MTLYTEDAVLQIMPVPPGSRITLRWEYQEVEGGETQTATDEGTLLGWAVVSTGQYTDGLDDPPLLTQGSEIQPFFLLPDLSHKPLTLGGYNQITGPNNPRDLRVEYLLGGESVA